MYTVTINNMSDWAKNKRYIVARVCEGELWYWGATDDEARAKAMITELENAIMVVNEDVE